MQSLHVPDVGHGLSAYLKTLSGKRLQIDCGSNDKSEAAANHLRMPGRYHAFALSHFHTDHYNALASLNDNELVINRVYMPILPDFQNRKRIGDYILAMSRRALGGKTGHMHADFLRLVDRVSIQTPQHRLLSRGDKFTLGSSKFEVLWPPKVINGTPLKDEVDRAIKDFDEAMEEDDDLRRIYHDVVENQQLNPYLEEQDFSLDDEQWESEPLRSFDRAERESEEIPDVVSQANKSLRSVANRLSLVFHLDNRFLYMGDLEEEEIENIVVQLNEKNRTDFLAMITPHHGTHAHPSLQDLRTVYAISSVGQQYVSGIKDIFKDMSDLHWVTHLSGDFRMPPHSYRYPSQPFWPRP